jgi:hypothetical protein
MTPRDFRAHVIQLCNMIEDGYAGYSILDWATLLSKARQVRAAATEDRNEHKT